MSKEPVLSQMVDDVLSNSVRATVHTSSPVPHGKRDQRDARSLARMVRKQT
jgi:hypothetical protein